MVPRNKNRFVKFLADKRFYFQVVIGIAIYIAINRFHISLWWMLGAGTFLGIIWGKVFCRWMCPIGIMMELFMKMNVDASFKNMYQYHKIGCPVAWISGLLNRISLFRIRVDSDTCKSCGLCDKACYMPSIDKQKFSLYKADLLNPAQSYSCSKCLKCVEKCPNGSLSFKPVIHLNKLK